MRPLVVDDRLQPTGYVAYRGAVPVDAVDRRVALDEVVAWMDRACTSCGTPCAATAAGRCRTGSPPPLVERAGDPAR